MKARMYWTYATRSLVRGGQRTLLAVFCIAVGVMAIVSLQLVGSMVNHALTDNIRAANGGDLAVSNGTSQIPAASLATFDQLVAQGTLTSYTAVAQVTAETNDTRGMVHQVQLWAVDPEKFPLAGTPEFANPSDGQVGALLTGNQVVVTQNMLADQALHVGARIVVHSLGRS